MLDYPEYQTKLDSYYYDSKLKTTIVVLKIRNKRSMQHLPIKKLLSYKSALNSLHPIDLCIIGILSNSSSIKNNSDQLTPILDIFPMTRMEPLLEIVGNNFNESEEILAIKLKPLNKIINISANELYNNKYLLNALKYQDAISLGYSVSASTFEKEKIIYPKKTYSGNLCILNGLFCISFIISILLIDKSISFLLPYGQIKIQGDILLLPLLFFTNNFSLKKYGIKNTNNFILSNVILLIIFLLYFGIITHLPYSINDKTTEAFNLLFKDLINKTPLYLLCLFSAFSGNLCIALLFKHKLINFGFILNKIFINYFDILVFFAFLFVLVPKNQNFLLLKEFFYVLLIKSLLRILAKLFIINKSTFETLKSIIKSKFNIFLKF